MTIRKKAMPAAAFLASLASLAFLALSGAGAQGASITNGSFESVGFTGWITKDIARPYSALAVRNAGFGGSFSLPAANPTDGTHTAFTGFDGGGPGVISLAQDIGIVGSGDALRFDYQAGWDFSLGAQATQPRLFDVVLEPAGGGTPLSTANFLNTGTSSNPNTGPLKGFVDLTPLIGRNVRLKFVWTIPQDFTGPGSFQIDNVTISPVPVPIPLLLFLSGLAGLAIIGRRRGAQGNHFAGSRNFLKF